MTGFWDDDRVARRTLGTRDKQILYERAHHKCENPGCRKEIEFSEMQVGHKRPYSKGGSTTLKNSVALCWRCNKLQGTDSWEKFLKKQGLAVPPDPSGKVKEILLRLSLSELKYLASKHGVKPKSKLVEGGLFESDRYVAPSKERYIKELAKVISENEVKSSLSEMLNSKLR